MKIPKEQKANVYFREYLAGCIIKNKEGFTFTYDNDYFKDVTKPAIAISFPKNNKIFKSKYLFPFFFGLLSEGYNKEIQCRNLKIDEKDYFTRLLKTAYSDTIGAITVREIK